MNITHWTLDYEERLSPAYTLPGGRFIEAKLETAAIVFVGEQPKTPETTQLIVEVRQTPDDEFIEVARTPELQAGAVAKVAIPTEPEERDVMVRPPVVRYRVIHRGRGQPRFTVSDNI